MSWKFHSNQEIILFLYFMKFNVPLKLLDVLQILFYILKVDQSLIFLKFLHYLVE